MLHLRPERFLKKLLPKTRAGDPFSILYKLGYNAYFLDLPNDMNITPTFNVEDLSPYQGPSKPFTLPLARVAADCHMANKAWTM
jgi:hypothetical protein